MVLTRRRLLHATAAAAAALAGCGGSSRSDPPASREPPENVERDPDAVVVRTSDREPAAWLPDEDADATRSGPPEHVRRHAFVASAESADRVRYADVDGVEAAREFVAATDFDRETVYLETSAVDECHRNELCYVTWSRTEIDTQYGSHLRDADVDCDPDARDAETWFVRVPDAIDPERVTQRGSGWSSGGCDYPPHLRDTTRTTTERPMVGPAGNDTAEDDR